MLRHCSYRYIKSVLLMLWEKFQEQNSPLVHVQFHIDTSSQHCSYCGKNLKNKNSHKLHKYLSHASKNSPPPRPTLQSPPPKLPLWQSPHENSTQNIWQNHNQQVHDDTRDTDDAIIEHSTSGKLMNGQQHPPTVPAQESSLKLAPEMVSQTVLISGDFCTKRRARQGLSRITTL